MISRKALTDELMEAATPNQHLARSVLWIRIHMDPHHFCNLDPHKTNPDQDRHPDPHQSDQLDLEPDSDAHQFADDKPQCMEYEHILALFHGFKPFFGS
jgi:hypothetical protein